MRRHLTGLNDEVWRRLELGSCGGHATSGLKKQSRAKLWRLKPMLIWHYLSMIPKTVVDRISAIVKILWKYEVTEDEVTSFKDILIIVSCDIDI